MSGRRVDLSWDRFQQGYGGYKQAPPGWEPETLPTPKHRDCSSSTHIGSFSVRNVKHSGSVLHISSYLAAKHSAGRTKQTILNWRDHLMPELASSPLKDPVAPPFRPPGRTQAVLLSSWQS
ncbi:hypothetical protein PtB15_12B58 [Puccinia triticina]|nr:hypothetical protein PtB15_12B58 [Puccinia triticina]